MRKVIPHHELKDYIGKYIKVIPDPYYTGHIYGFEIESKKLTFLLERVDLGTLTSYIWLYSTKSKAALKTWVHVLRSADIFLLHEPVYIEL